MDALQKNGFTTFTNEAQSPPQDSDKLGKKHGGKYTMEAQSKANSAITMKVQFLGSPDDKAKWAMGDAMRVSLIDYVQAFPDARAGGDAETKAMVDTLVTKAEAKYGKAGEVVLEPIQSNQSRLAFWGNSAVRSIATEQSKYSPMHFTVGAVNKYFDLIRPPLVDPYKSQLVQCRKRQNDQMSTVYITDDVRDCMEAVLKSEHAHLAELAPILVAGSDVNSPAFQLMLVDPYIGFTYDINQDYQEVLRENQAWHQHQAAMKKETGNTAF